MVRALTRLPAAPARSAAHAWPRMIGASSARVRSGWNWWVEARDGSVHTWSMKYVLVLCTPVAHVPVADVLPTTWPPDEAEVVVGVPLGERAADVGPGRARCRPEVHGAHELRAVDRVGVHQEGGVRRVEAVGLGDLPVGVVDQVPVGVRGRGVAGRGGGGEACVLRQRGRGLGNELVGRRLLGRRRGPGRHGCHHHAVGHGRRALDIAAHGRRRLPPRPRRRRDEPGSANFPWTCPAIEPDCRWPRARRTRALRRRRGRRAPACDEASDTVVAANTRTAAMPTAARPVHHSRAARPSADQRSVIDCLIRCIRCVLLVLICSFGTSVACRCDERRQSGCEGSVMPRRLRTPLGRAGTTSGIRPAAPCRTASVAIPIASFCRGIRGHSMESDVATREMQCGVTASGSLSRKVYAVRHRLDLIRFSLRTVTALVASLFVVVLGVSGIVGAQAATAATASARGAGAPTVGRQRDHHRSAAVQLRQRRSDLWPGR